MVRYIMIMKKQNRAVRTSMFEGYLFFKQNTSFLIFATLIYLGISLLPSLFNKIQSPVAQLLITAFMLIISSVVAIGMIQVSLAIYDKNPRALAELFYPVGLFVPYILASILVLGISLIGLVLFIVPGIILLARLSYTDYIIAEYECGPVDALKYSWTLTQGATVQILLLSIVSLLLNIVGLLFLGVGLLVTLPVTMMARTSLYRTLQASRTIA